MYLDGQTYSEIRQKTRHSFGAIKRYLANFVKVMMSQSRGIRRVKEISMVTGLSEVLVKQYIELRKEINKDKTRRDNLKLLLIRSSYREGIKKRTKSYSKPLAAMIGGLS